VLRVAYAMPRTRRSMQSPSFVPASRPRGRASSRCAGNSRSRSPVLASLSAQRSARCCRRQPPKIGSSARPATT
jgi:hypothetical protein